ncbi:unnamed protein product [Sphagnum troendelagicum]|uniref:Uncharacterized protein n=1 Tax=Sphagnum troendelagicum TaxID=128251 RepID=A0ABP0TMP1_9BRYO
MKGELVQQLHWGAKKFSCGQQQQQLRSKLYNNNNNNNNRWCPGKLNYNNNKNRCVQPAIDEEQRTKGDAN